MELHLLQDPISSYWHGLPHGIRSLAASKSQALKASDAQVYKLIKRRKLESEVLAKKKLRLLILQVPRNLMAAMLV